MVFREECVELYLHFPIYLDGAVLDGARDNFILSLLLIAV
jgi:hypothetical protein